MNIGGDGGGGDDDDDDDDGGDEIRYPKLPNHLAIFSSAFTPRDKAVLPPK
jgi:hypothetical protein